ncbi:hypothetical protein BDV98DRAFT_123359 [Pterulicium gracile]|uniref:Uncharacterized protein n=1 Tax=Pterulicium gracile TaxID=1884261 RepID=A0A5C3QDR4_9AGAR|nr:hypothetical protein BDV98DRAFT_123359 [Pterula gracilis]
MLISAEIVASHSGRYVSCPGDAEAQASYTTWTRWRTRRLCPARASRTRLSLIASEASLSKSLSSKGYVSFFLSLCVLRSCLVEEG